ncbi:MAG: DUF3795 domain-containing protein [Candidatus Riflebacteria bacterium]|nr:DUF3795 domain-containing protein [Candidatus Riflebacteria bacterium]
MKKDKNFKNIEKMFAAVCGLYCEACSWYIATTEEPERLKRLSKQMNFSEAESKCYGCRSHKRLPYCENCKMFACANDRGIDFCSECDEYPCNILKQFQSAMPHRIELFDNLDQIKSVGYKQWLNDIKTKYTCSKCQSINSTYDLKCRKCGLEPSCNYVTEHRQQIEDYLRKRNT